MAKPVCRSLLLWLFCWPALLLAQTNEPAGLRYPSNRYLLVVETSRAMLHRSDQMAQKVQQLLGSALARQARRGDSLGVWTFNEKLYTGVLPLQEWTPEQQKAITERVVGFLRAQKFEKKARFDQVLPPLFRLVKNSPFLTVILVCVGDEEVQGTAFDQRINDFFQNWRQQQLDARTPFVVVLRAQNGRLVDCLMNSAPWPVELPDLPKELFIAKPSPRPVVATPQKPPTSQVPPLIIIGKKHEPAASVTNSPLADAKPSATVPINTNVVSDSPPKAPGLTVGQPATQAEGSPEASKPRPTASSQDATAPIQSPAAGTSQVAQQPVPALSAPKVPAAEPIARTSTPPPIAPLSGAKSIIPETSPPLEPARSNVADAQKLAGASPSAAALVIAAPVNVASATPATARSARRIVWLALSAGGLIAVALAAFWIWKQRARPPADVSLITESIDRRKR